MRYRYLRVRIQFHQDRTIKFIHTSNARTQECQIHNPKATPSLAPRCGTTRPDKGNGKNAHAKGKMGSWQLAPVSSPHPLPAAAATVAAAALTSSARSSCTHPLGIRLLAALMHSAAPGALKKGHNGLVAHCKHFDCAYLMSDDSGGGDGSG